MKSIKTVVLNKDNNEKDQLLEFTLLIGITIFLSLVISYVCVIWSKNLVAKPLFGNYVVEPIFIFYFIFLIAMCGVKNKRNAMAVIFVSFFIIFICSKSGADFESYKGLYEQVSRGDSFNEIHGEFLYLTITKMASYIMPFEVFKILFLGSFMLLMIYSIYKLTPRPVLAFLLMYCGVTLYLLTILRQFAAIAIFFYSLTAIQKKHNIRALFLTFISTFIHVGGFVGFIVILYMVAVRCNPKVKLLRNVLLLFVALSLRLIMYRLFKLPMISTLIERITFYKEVKLMSFGVLSRIAEMLLLSVFYRFFNLDNWTRKLFNIIFICTLFYIMIPLELLMARLIISFRFIVAFLTSVVSIYQIKTTKLQDNKLLSTKEFNIARLGLILLYFAIFLSQMMFQSGYTPYISLLFD